MSHEEQTRHDEKTSTIDVETAEEHPATEVSLSPQHAPSHVSETHESADISHVDHHRKESLISLHSLKDPVDPPADKERASNPTSPMSPSDAGSPKSPELNDVNLEELSLDDPEPLKLETTLLEPAHASVAASADSPLATTKPKGDGGEGEKDEESLSSNRASRPPSAAKSPQTALDSLLSPTKADFKFPIRDSVAASDTTDDETRFSTVLLSSARTSVDPEHVSLGTPLSAKLSETLMELPEEEHEGAGEGKHDDRRDTLDGNEIVRLIHRNRVHKKTASTSTIVSGSNVPFILARVEGEENKRSSLDGKQKLQEEFEKKHESQDSRAEANVDWGALPFANHYIHSDISYV